MTLQRFIAHFLVEPKNIKKQKHLSEIPGFHISNLFKNLPWGYPHLDRHRVTSVSNRRQDTEASWS